jgi:hypothetical protein
MRWWQQNPAYGVGIICGQVSGVIVSDVDPRNGGRESINDCSRHLPITACVNTPSGGFHYWYSLPNGVILPKKTGILPGVDLQGEGSYVCAPPSDNGDGDYTWAITLQEAGLAELPAWMIALTQRQERPALASPGDSRPLSDLPVGERPPGAALGKRNPAATGLAGRLIACGFSEEDTLRHIWDWDKLNTPPMAGDPKEEHKVRDMVRRLVAKEQAKPPGARGLRIPRELLKRDLGDGPILLAAHLLAYAQEGRQTPSWRDMGHALGANPATVWRWRKAQAKGAVSPTDLEARPTQRYFAIPRGLLFDTGLSRGERVTALLLASFMHAGTARVALKVLAQVRGLSSKQVQRHLGALETAGHLETTREVYDPTLGKRALPNLYRFATGVPNVAPVSSLSEAVYSGSMTESAWNTPAVAARASR